MVAEAATSAEQGASTEADEGSDQGLPLRTVVLLLAAVALVGGFALVALAVLVWLRTRRPSGEKGSDKGEE